jgi:membrane protein implicated in regulation of membrane protease activity
MDEEAWRWVWMVAAVVFAVGEMLVAGTFFLLPFAVGALAACIGAFAGANLFLQWVLFVGVSALSLGALYPLRKRFDRADSQDGIGARRLIGQPGSVLREITAGPDGAGLVRVGREEWRAQSLDGAAIPAGSVVRIVEVRGTRVIVHPTSSPALDGSALEEGT